MSTTGMRHYTSYGPNAKRMRLGTKSCVECRRRKIRCITQSGQQYCDSCVAHRTLCQAQYPTAKGTPSSDGNDTLLELDDMTARLQAQLQATHVSSSPSQSEEISTTHKSSALYDAGHWSSSSSASAGRSTSSYADEPISPQRPSDGTADSFTGAPLMELLKDANLLQTQNRPQNQRSIANSNSRSKALIRSLFALLPDKGVLQVVLTESSPFWCTWPPCYYCEEPAKQLQPGQQAEAIYLIYSAFHAQQPAVVAKAMLFLSLCLQQLPKHVGLLLPPISPLISDCIDLCSALLSMGGDSRQGLADLEARTLLYKLCLDLGKPRRAWSTIRGAVDSAMMQGMHRLGNNVSMRQKLLWDMIWQGDRQSSSLLGTPYSISNGHPSTSSPSGDTVVEQISFSMARLTGDIIDRDQNLSSNPNYATTVQLDQDCAAIRRLMPPEWFDPGLQANMTLSMLFFIQCTKMKYLVLVKEIHLPWMLKATVEPRYHHSRTSTLEASRDFITAYLDLRENPKTRDMNCEIMDFEAFTAAVVLIIGLLSDAAISRQPVSDTADWHLVAAGARCLTQTAERLECTIAAQGVQVIEFLTKACRGDTTIPAKFETAIPFFGQVRINRAAIPQPPAQTATEASGTELLPTEWLNTIEFSANVFGHNVPAEFGFDAELAVDWTSLVDFDTTYDWSQAFGQADFDKLNVGRIM